jgi:hypothetical protein
MLLKKMAPALSMCCFLLATACDQTVRVAVPIIPPADRLACVPAGDRPAIPAEYVIDWSLVTSVDQAKAEHLRYVASVRNREGMISGYIVVLEGKLFGCSNNAAWLRDFYAAQKKGGDSSPPPQ